MIKEKIDLTMIYEELEENQYKDLENNKKQELDEKMLHQQSTLVSGDLDKKTGKPVAHVKVIEKTPPINIFDDTDIELLDTPIVKVEDEKEEVAFT
mmetsp:Transcript_64703/g.54905  ORF Transcript_64703/g.54905 Transcript_64703/m.54905 type:complete len:96 (-) Transcript_64703:29-316(-)